LFPIRRISPSDDDRDWTAVRTTLVRYICGHTGQSGLAEEVAQETPTGLIALQQRGEIGCADAGLSADRPQPWQPDLSRPHCDGQAAGRGRAAQDFAL